MNKIEIDINNRISTFKSRVKISLREFHPIHGNRITKMFDQKLSTEYLVSNYTSGRPH